MKNKIIIVSITAIILFSLTACAQKEPEVIDSLKFKEDYESVNGETNSSGKVYRNISIAEDNPFVYLTAEELLEKMDNKETFYVYFGSKLCPWCRSVIEKAIEVSKERGIEKIYYIDIWDDTGNEILRDKYILNSNNEPEQILKGTDAYYELLDKLIDILPNYSLKDEDGNNVDIGEKRIYAPSFIYIKNGVAENLVEGTSDKQTDSRAELTDEILEEEAKIFNEFFNAECADGLYC